MYHIKMPIYYYYVLLIDLRTLAHKLLPEKMSIQVTRSEPIVQ